MVEQSVEVIRYRDRDTDKPNLGHLKHAIDLGLVLVKFMETKGGTELGANLCNDDGKLNAANFKWDDVKGTLHVEGRLKLDYTPVKLIATIDLKTFKGKGKLEVVPDFEIKRE
jgi:hypothetical protein